MHTFKNNSGNIIIEDDFMSLVTINKFTNIKMLLEAIHQRRSIRNYSDEAIPTEIINKINEYLSTPELMTGPLSGSHFKIVVLQKKMGDAPGTYGYIKNAPAVLAGVSNYDKLNLFDLAYVFHGLVLYLVSQGLQTCWVGASFKHDDIIEAGGVTKDEIVPAIAFFGYQKVNKNGERKKHTFEKIMLKGLKPHNRHPLEEFAFKLDFSTPLAEKAGEIFTEAFNIAKLSPSAQNKQSWRVVVADDKTVHFYVEKQLMHMVGEGFRKYACPPEYVEIGIFARQFSIFMEDKGINGQYVVEDPRLNPPTENYEYIVTWKRT